MFSGWSDYKVAALAVGGVLILGGFARLRSGRADKAARAAWMRVVGRAGVRRRGSEHQGTSLAQSLY